jgi:hypothetical protein
VLICLQIFRLNTLETLYLVTSLFVLLAGMTFQSGVTSEGSGAHELLTYFVLLVLVACVGTIFGAVGLEMYRSLTFARRIWITRHKSGSMARAGPGTTTSIPSPSASGRAPSTGISEPALALGMVFAMDNPLVSRNRPGSLRLRRARARATATASGSGEHRDVMMPVAVSAVRTRSGPPPNLNAAWRSASLIDKSRTVRVAAGVGPNASASGTGTQAL